MKKVFFWLSITFLVLATQSCIVDPYYQSSYGYECRDTYYSPRVHVDIGHGSYHHGDNYCH